MVTLFSTIGFEITVDLLLYGKLRFEIVCTFFTCLCMLLYYLSSVAVFDTFCVTSADSRGSSS
jgi:hypothetical protein